MSLSPMSAVLCDTSSKAGTQGNRYENALRTCAKVRNSVCARDATLQAGTYP